MALVKEAPIGKKYPHVMGIRLRPEDRAKLQSLAEQWGVRPSTLMRKLIEQASLEVIVRFDRAEGPEEK